MRSSCIVWTSDDKCDFLPDSWIFFVSIIGWEARDRPVKGFNKFGRVVWWMVWYQMMRRWTTEWKRSGKKVIWLDSCYSRSAFVFLVFVFFFRQIGPLIFSSLGYVWRAAASVAHWNYITAVRHLKWQLCDWLFEIAVVLQTSFYLRCQIQHT